MRNRDFLIVSLNIAAISGCVYRFSAVTMTLWLLAMFIFWRRVSVYRLGLFIGIGLPFLCYFMWDAQMLSQQANKETSAMTHISGRILPDDITVNGATVRGQCQLDDSGETVIFFYQVKSEQAKQRWLTIRQPVHLTGQGSMKRLLPATNFNQFDAQDFYATQHITHQITLSQCTVTQSTAQSIWQKLADQLHGWHAQGIASAQRLPQPLGEYAQALIMGTASRTLYERNPGVQTLGLIHLFSVSGFQVTYLLALLVIVLCRLWCPQELTAVFGVGVLLAYFVFAGAPGILVRAVIAGFFSLSRLFGYRALAQPVVWSMSLLGSLLYQPAILLTLGGQLSFALTFCLLFTRQLTFWQTNLWLSMVSFVLITPQQYTWHLLQTLANWAAIPLFSLVIVPCVLIGWLAQPLVEVVRCMNSVIAFFARTLDGLAQLPGQLIIGKLPWWLIICLLILAVVSFVTHKKIAYVARWAWAILLVMGIMSMKYPLRGEFTTFDIGQGDAALLRTPGNRVVTLIDTGGAPQFRRQQPWQQASGQRSAGETVIVNYLHSLSIGRVDYLVLTHHDLDHIGYAKVILEKMVVKYVIVPAGMAQQTAFQQEIQPFLGRAKVVEVTAGTSLSHFPGQILHPFHSGHAENDDSIAIWSRIGGQNILTAGDLGQAGEAELVARYPDMRVDMLKLGHHGSKTATNPVAISHWQPKIALISAGRENRYHHPHLETLKTIQENGLTIYNTQTNGMIRYSYVGEKGRFEVKFPNESATITTTNTK